MTLHATRDAMQTLVLEQQKQICEALEALDGSGKFTRDQWERPEGGGGISCVLREGAIFEKVGVNVSVVHGTLSPEAAASMGGGQSLSSEADLRFFATGLSLIAHAKNPYVPTVHCNYRYFERGDGPTPAAWWFGGGADLTPSYLFDEDAQHFHGTHADACDRHDPSFYPAFKAWCDRYFRIAHRKESRGLGGIFFDNLCDRSQQELLAFVADCLGSLIPAYAPIVERRKDTPYGEAQRRWQQLRRGRYVEFNLVYDRGTLFGLQSGGRAESILMSLPPLVRWEYGYAPAPGSDEALLSGYLRPRNWLLELL